LRVSEQKEKWDLRCFYMVQPYLVVRSCDEKVHVDNSCVKYLAYGVGVVPKAFLAAYYSCNG
jgi:hypothetical protein